MPTLPDGRSVSDDQYQAYWTQIFRNDPAMQAIHRDVTSPGYATRARAAQEAARKEVARLRAAGLPVSAELSYAASHVNPDAEQSREIAARQRALELGYQAPGNDWSLDFDQDGFRVERENFVNRNQDWLIPGAIGAVGAAGALGAFGGGAGAASAGGGATGSSAVATGIPAGSATLGPGVGMGAGGVPVGSTLGGAVAPSAGSGIASGLGTAASAAGGGLPFWAKAAMGFGSDALKTFFANKASGKANEALQAGGDKAIATFTDALGPYMNLGGQAAGNLGFLMGTGPLPGTGGGYGTSSAPVSAPIVSPNQSTGRTMPEGGMVTGQAIPRPQAPPNMVDPRGGFGSLAGRVDPARAQTASSFVRMVNPAGEEDDIPADKVQDAIRMFGARPVDGPAVMGRG